VHCLGQKLHVGESNPADESLPLLGGRHHHSPPVCGVDRPGHEMAALQVGGVPARRGTGHAQQIGQFGQTERTSVDNPGEGDGLDAVDLDPDPGQNPLMKAGYRHLPNQTGEIALHRFELFKRHPNRFTDLLALCKRKGQAGGSTGHVAGPKGAAPGVLPVWAAVRTHCAEEFLDGINVTQDQVYIRALAVDFFISLLKTVEDWSERTLAEIETWDNLEPSEEKNRRGLDKIRLTPVDTPAQRKSDISIPPQSQTRG
jgi:hypothetical protein